MEDFLDQSYIHIEQVSLRVHVLDINSVPIEQMNESEIKPPFVLWVAKSNDPEQNKDSFLIQITGDYDMKELDKWIKSFQ